jgi:hypothetical protein
MLSQARQRIGHGAAVLDGQLRQYDPDWHIAQSGRTIPSLRSAANML